MYYAYESINSCATQRNAKALVISGMFLLSAEYSSLIYTPITSVARPDSLSFRYRHILLQFFETLQCTPDIFADSVRYFRNRIRKASEYVSRLHKLDVVCSPCLHAQGIGGKQRQWQRLWTCVSDKDTYLALRIYRCIRTKP